DIAPGARVVVSTDTSAEDVHFRAGWFDPAEVGWRAATSALSDLAAMAARPLGLVLAASVPPRWRDALPEIGDGIGDAAAAVSCPIVGGDLTGGRDLVLTVTVVGEAEHPVSRGGAHVGDALYVTGRLGGPRRALEALLRGALPDAADRARFARPRARLAEARWLAAHGARALVDLSDGLVADAGHIAAASGCDLAIDPHAVPRVGGATVDEALRGGEEYELICAAPPTLEARAFTATFGLELTRIGAVVAASPGGPRVVIADGGGRVDLPGGYDHFTR
ncbi:MAG TPA: thiamine-phosphate kinase, partial [Gemmatirosa sp.]